MEYDPETKVDVIIRTGGHAGLWSGCMEGECYERYNLWVESEYLYRLLWINQIRSF